jgi:hypothetical protein
MIQFPAGEIRFDASLSLRKPCAELGRSHLPVVTRQMTARRSSRSEARQILVLLDLQLLVAFERGLVFRRDPPSHAQDGKLDPAARADPVLITVPFERHERPLSGRLPQALAVSLGQLAECAETAP